MSNELKQYSKSIVDLPPEFILLELKVYDQKNNCILNRTYQTLSGNTVLNKIVSIISQITSSKILMLMRNRFFSEGNKKKINKWILNNDVGKKHSMNQPLYDQFTTYGLKKKTSLSFIKIEYELKYFRMIKLQEPKNH